jgi:hypothetical protein
MRFGRWNNNICAHSTVNANTAPVSKTYTISDALGKKDYTIDNKLTHPNIKEDPYPGVYKHWKVDYTCG